MSTPIISRTVKGGLLPEGGTYREWLLVYIEKLRQSAAGRGGEKQEGLAEAKAEEARMKTALNRLIYHEKIGTLAPAVDVEAAFIDWAGYAQREVEQALYKIADQIEESGVEIDQDIITNGITTITGRITSYSDKLSADFEDSSGEFEA